ncbi:hypothetical protein Ddye_030031 [Dipteronia dyeriana]|uniref:Reverse transcriptase zinc-binding domain-containing protein n=1 Tax=Dipteronia dyeriana TaxID=168575 RepID=A0AAD9TGM7_9ROSI|nr:hypothetical protein Ddye_030031 [Dipteronia dyeriana]
MKLPYGGWNVNLVHESFLSADADLILSLPLSNSVVEDSLLWHFETSGCYTVRSGYRVGCSMVLNPSPYGLDKTVKNLLSKACNHWIPSNANLAKRGLSVNSSCTLCHSRIESTIHAMWGCPTVKLVWSMCPFMRGIPVNDGLHFLDFLESCRNKLRCNGVMHKSGSFPISDVVPWAFSFLSEFHRTNSKSMEVSSSSEVDDSG